MPKLRIHITMDVRIHEKAQEIMVARCFGDLSSFVEQLIREEWERRKGPMTFPSPEAVALQLNETKTQAREKEDVWKDSKPKP